MHASRKRGNRQSQFGAFIIRFLGPAKRTLPVVSTVRETLEKRQDGSQRLSVPSLGGRAPIGPRSAAIIREPYKTWTQTRLLSLLEEAG